MIKSDRWSIMEKILTGATPAHVCAPSGQNIVKSVDVDCVLCDARITMDEKNVEPSKAINGVPVCIDCCRLVIEATEGDCENKSMIGGKLMSVQEGMRLTDAMARRN